MKLFIRFVKLFNFLYVQNKPMGIQKNQVLKHNHFERYILIIAINKFKNIKTNTEEVFCTYYWSEYGMVGTDLLENIVRDYKLIR